MELRAGYKQTEVGSIPEEWDAVLVGDFFTFKNGLNKAKHFFGHGTPIVNYMDVFGRPSFRIEELRGRVEVSKAELKAYEVCRGDVFFTRTSETIDEIGVASVLLGEAERTVFSGFVLRARPTVDALVDEFKSYCFSPRYFRQQVTTRASYTTRALINGRSLSATFLAKPPKSEQTAIATALSDVDALLAAQDALITKKRAIKQGAMQELLTGKRRLPGFSGEWEVKKIPDLERQNVIRLSRGQVISKKDINNTPGDFPIYSSSIHNNGLFGRYGDFMFEEELITWSVDGGGNFFHRPKHKFSVTNVCGFMRADISRVSYQFLAAYLQHLHSRKSFDYQSKAHPSVVRKEYEIQLPSLAEQVAIAGVLSDMDNEITAIETQRAKTAKLKQGMMQALLTGRIRLI